MHDQHTNTLIDVGPTGADIFDVANDVIVTAIP